MLEYQKKIFYLQDISGLACIPVHYLYKNQTLQDTSFLTFLFAISMYTTLKISTAVWNKCESYILSSYWIIKAKDLKCGKGQRTLISFNCCLLSQLAIQSQMYLLRRHLIYCSMLRAGITKQNRHLRTSGVSTAFLTLKVGTLQSHSVQLKCSHSRCIRSRQMTRVQATWDFKNRQTLVLLKKQV